MKRLLLVVAGGSALVTQRMTMRATPSSALRTRIRSQTKIKRTLVTLGRVALPSMIATGLGFEYYDNLSSFIQANWLDANSIKFLSSDEIQFLPSFLTVISLLFSILACIVLFKEKITSRELVGIFIVMLSLIGVIALG